MGRNKVKPEQASKVLMRMPTLRSFGEGCTRGEVIDKRTHAIRRGSGYGTSVGWFVVTGGDPSRARVAASTSRKAAAMAGVGPGSMTLETREHWLAKGPPTLVGLLRRPGRRCLP